MITIYIVVAILFSVTISGLVLLHLIHMGWAKPTSPTDHFAIGVVVPCKGNDDPNFKENLIGIIQQEYHGSVQFVFAAESELDPAVPTLRELASEFDKVQVCIAGLSTTCAQKIYNIVQGIKYVPQADIYVFADADIQPHPTWLREMVSPFQETQVGATTGFFRRIPVSPRFRWGDYIAGFFSSIIVIGMTNNRVKGLWGGSLGIRKSLFDQYNIPKRLENAIVDDVAIMYLLREHGIERRFVPSCTLRSYTDMSVISSLEWFIRQIQFSQIYLKDLYWLYFLGGVPYSILIALTPLVFGYGLIFNDPRALVGSLLFWAGVMFMSALLYWGIPSNATNADPDRRHYRLWLWTLLAPVACMFSLYALLTTTQRVKGGVLTMLWRGIEYQVDVQTGEVLRIIRPEHEQV